MAMQTPETQILPIAPNYPDLDALTKWAGDLTRTLQQNLGGIARKANDNTSLNPAGDINMNGHSITNILNLGNISGTITYKGADIDNRFVLKAGDTMTGGLILPAGTTSVQPLIIPHGAAATSPTNGSLWSTTAAFFGRINGTTRQFTTLDGTETLTNKTINGSNNTITNVSLTAGVTGVLPVANGGTNISSYASGDLIYASGATTLSKLAKGTANQTLQMDGSGALPTWVTVSAVSGVLVAVQVFTASGTYTPTGGATKAFAIVTGGGAGGGSGTLNTNGGSGGGAGGTTLAYISSLSTLTVTIGGGGAAGSGGNQTSLGTITANGGSAGVSGAGRGGAGGTATGTGTLGVAGGDGDPSNTGTSGTSLGGTGGASFWGSGGSGGSGTSGGRAGVAYGSGGGGGGAGSGGTGGAAGAGGVVVVMEYK